MHRPTHASAPSRACIPPHLPSPYPYFAYFADRKSTRLNSSHSQISYAVFCLKKKNRISVHDTTANPADGAADASVYDDHDFGDVHVHQDDQRLAAVERGAMSRLLTLCHPHPL